MSQRLRYPEFSPEGVGALRGLEHFLNASSGLEPVLLELVRLRSSQLNGCEYCIALHSAELQKHHEPASRIDTIATWPASDAFTERERAALRWAEVITDVQQGHAPDDEYAAVRLHFSDVETVNLTLAIAGINAWNRMAIAFRPQWHERSAIADDGGKVALDAEPHP